MSLVAGATMGAVMLALNAQGPSTTALHAAHNVGQMRTGQGVRPALPFVAARGPLSQPPAPAVAAARPLQAPMHNIYSPELAAGQGPAPDHGRRFGPPPPGLAPAPPWLRTLPLAPPKGWPQP